MVWRGFAGYRREDGEDIGIIKAAMEPLVERVDMLSVTDKSCHIIWQYFP